jgi:biopolymer transport protein ExbD
MTGRQIAFCRDQVLLIFFISQQSSAESQLVPVYLPSSRTAVNGLPLTARDFNNPAVLHMSCC